MSGIRVEGKDANFTSNLCWAWCPNHNNNNNDNNNNNNNNNNHRNENKDNVGDLWKTTKEHGDGNYDDNEIESKKSEELDDLMMAECIDGTTGLLASSYLTKTSTKIGNGTMNGNDDGGDKVSELRINDSPYDEKIGKDQTKNRNSDSTDNVDDNDGDHSKKVHRISNKRKQQEQTSPSVSTTELVRLFVHLRFELLSWFFFMTTSGGLQYTTNNSTIVESGDTCGDNSIDNTTFSDNTADLAIVLTGCKDDTDAGTGTDSKGSSIFNSREALKRKSEWYEDWSKINTANGNVLIDSCVFIPKTLMELREYKCQISYKHETAKDTLLQDHLVFRGWMRRSNYERVKIQKFN